MHSIKSVFLLGLAGAVLAASADVGLSLVGSRPEGLRPLGAFLSTFSSSVVVYALLSAALLSTVELLAWRRWVTAVREHRLTVMFSLMWLAILTSLTRTELLPSSKGELLALTAVIGASVSLGVNTEPMLRRAWFKGGQDIQAAVVSWGPWLSFLSALSLWLYKFRSDQLPSFLFLVLLVAYVVLVATALLTSRSLVNQPGRRQWATQVTAILALAAAHFILWAESARDDEALVRETGAAEIRTVKHVILITVDTLRADALSVYDPRRTTPTFDALAEDSVVFGSAMSPSPWTKPSVVSLMTGLHPSVHGVTAVDSPVPTGVNTLAELFRSSGYHTAAFVSNPLLSPGGGIGQGFEHFVHSPRPSRGHSVGAEVAAGFVANGLSGRVPDKQLTDLAADYLAAHSERPLFLWLHLFDPHMPYNPLVPPSDPQAPFDFFSAMREVRYGSVTLGPAGKARVRVLYDAEVSQVDDNLHTMVTRLKTLEIYDASLLAVTSDHGEEFWEHGSLEHGHSLYEEVLRVPLLVKLPESESRGRIGVPVTTVRLARTILEVCEVPFEEAAFDADSLVDLWAGSGETPTQANPIIGGGLSYPPVPIICETTSLMRLVSPPGMVETPRL